MTIPSENVANELKHLEEEWQAGIDEGYSQNPNLLPDFYSKPYMQLTARQRGIVFGRELRIHDKEQSNAEIG